MEYEDEDFSFISQGLWELVDKGYEKVEIPVEAIRDVQKKDAKALFFIQQAETIFPRQQQSLKKLKMLCK